MMLSKIFIFFGLCVILYNECIFGNVQALIGRGIRPVEPNEYPFIVSIMLNKPPSAQPHLNLICTASLISMKDVLTSEQCFHGENETGIYVLAESVDLRAAQKKFIVWWFNYNNWNIKNPDKRLYEENDLAIARLRQGIKKIMLPAAITSMLAIDFFGIRVQMAGFGINNDGVKSNILQAMNVTVMSSSDCKKKIEKTVNKKVQISEKLICTKAKPYGLMQDGDIGGPLLYKGAIIGINRSITPTTERHSYKKKVNLHYSIHYYREFIAAVTNL